ncbi:MAG: PQQ-binding-like beta-propeller repeat protein, partial [Akkermansiaceae bacterium]
MRPFLLFLTLLLPLPGQENWPAFRGAGSRGISENPSLPDTWSSTANVAWKTDIPGRGWSSPVVWGKRVFLTTVVNLGDTESPKKGLYFGGNRPDIPESIHLW